MAKTLVAPIFVQSHVNKQIILGFSRHMISPLTTNHRSYLTRNVRCEEAL